MKTKKYNDLTFKVPDNHFYLTVLVKQVAKFSLKSREGKIGLCLLQCSSMGVYRGMGVIVVILGDSHRGIVSVLNMLSTVCRSFMVAVNFIHMNVATNIMAKGKCK